VFYSVGINGLIYTYCVLAADVTDLRNRGLAFAFTSSPYMITAFAGSKAAEGFLLHVNWRWGFDAFAIIFPCVCAPLFTLLEFNEHKAKKQGLLVREKSGPVTFNRIWRGIVDFDRKYNIESSQQVH
jgi:MFS family permease